MKSTGGRSRFQMLIQPAILPTHPHFTYILYLYIFATFKASVKAFPPSPIPSIHTKRNPQRHYRYGHCWAFNYASVFHNRKIYAFFSWRGVIGYGKPHGLSYWAILWQVNLWEKLSAMLRAHYQQVKHKSASFIHPHYHMNSLYISLSLSLSGYVYAVQHKLSYTYASKTVLPIPDVLLYEYLNAHCSVN